MAARGFLGAGDLYIAAYVAGVKQPYEGPFECRKFEIKPNSELKELVSKGRSTYGQVIESVPVPKPADVNAVRNTNGLGPLYAERLGPRYAGLLRAPRGSGLDGALLLARGLA